MVISTKKEEIRKSLLLRKSKLKEEKLEKIHHLRVQLANLAGSFVMWKYEKRRRLLRKRLLVKRKILKEEKLEKIEAFHNRFSYTFMFNSLTFIYLLVKN